MPERFHVVASLYLIALVLVVLPILLEINLYQIFGGLHFKWGHWFIVLCGGALLALSASSSLRKPDLLRRVWEDESSPSFWGLLSCAAILISTWYFPYGAGWSTWYHWQYVYPDDLSFMLWHVAALLALVAAIIYYIKPKR